MNIDDIVRLWYKTQEGHIDKCRENQIYFSDIMWKLHNNNNIENECWHCTACFTCRTFPCTCKEKE